jgi:Ras-related protein Rab-21
MQLWDTAGQERFKAMAPMYYRNANAALLVFDVTNHTSFEEVKSWILELQRNVQEPMFLLLVGNKIDLVEQRAVSREEAFIYAQSIGAKFLETSVVCDQVISHPRTKASPSTQLTVSLQGIEQVFVSIGLGLIHLSSESTCSSMKRYESKDSLYSSTHSSMTNLSGQTFDGVHMAIDISSHPNLEANGEGRVEMGPWSRDAIALADPQRSGWCC